LLFRGTLAWFDDDLGIARVVRLSSEQACQKALLLFEREDSILQRFGTLDERTDEGGLRVDPGERSVERLALGDLEMGADQSRLLARGGEEEGQTESDLLDLEERRLVALHTATAFLVNAGAVEQEKAEPRGNRRELAERALITRIDLFVGFEHDDASDGARQH